jgi:hypothetical protein
MALDYNDIDALNAFYDQLEIDTHKDTESIYRYETLQSNKWKHYQVHTFKKIWRMPKDKEPYELFVTVIETTDWTTLQPKKTHITMFNRADFLKDRDSFERNVQFLYDTMEPGDFKVRVQTNVKNNTEYITLVDSTPIRDVVVPDDYDTQY